MKREDLYKIRYKTTPLEIKSCHLLQFFWHVIHVQKLNLNIITYGLPQTGKSSIDQALAFQLDRNTYNHYTFKPKEQVAFGSERLFSIANKLKTRGKVLVAEEMGTTVGANARQWQSKTNQDLGDLFQILGFKGLIALINLPANMLLDKTPRTLVHGSITAKGIDRENGYIFGKFKLNEMNPETSKVYRKYLRYYDEDGIKRKITKFRIKIAPRFIMKDFREMETVWKNDLMKQKEKNAKMHTRLIAAKERSIAELKEIIDYVFANIKVFKGENKRLTSTDVLFNMPKEVALISKGEARVICSMVNRHFIKG